MFYLIGLGKVGGVHWHTDFEIVINGERVDFSKDTYMVVSEYVHLQNGDGTTIHKHVKGVTLTDFFTTICWELTAACLRTDTGEGYCPGEDGQLRIVLNGDEIDNPNEYKIQDVDQIRVTYE